MKKSILVMFTMGALLSTAQGGYYLASHGTNNWPPLPFNPRPGYPIITNGNALIVQDTISDQELLAQDLWLLDSNGPIPDGDETNAPPVPDTNAFLGLWIEGLYCPGGTNHSLSLLPDCWEIDCTNDNYSPYPHIAAWTGKTRVHPGDVVTVQFHEECTNHAPPWPCFIMFEYGTNYDGSYYTNYGFGRKDGYTSRLQWVIPDSLFTAYPMLTNPPCTNKFQFLTNDCFDIPFGAGESWLTNGTCVQRMFNLPPTTNGPTLPGPVIIQISDPNIGGDPISCLVKNLGLWLNDQFSAQFVSRSQAQAFHAVAVHSVPGTYVVEAQSNGGEWTTNADVFAATTTDLWTDSSGNYVWTNTSTIQTLSIDTNGVNLFFFGNEASNTSKLYRVRKLD